ncbi:HD domain-containing protein [Alkalihalobacillus sp. FSL R5-0424]
MNSTIIEETEQWVREKLSDDTSGHDWYHIMRVTALAQYLCKDTAADKNTVVLASLLHDLADDKLIEDEEAGRQMIADWLKDKKVAKETIDHILLIISTMSFKGGTGSPMETLEGQIVQDADRLDALGAIGIARTFTYSGHKQQPMYDPHLPTRENMTAEEYRKGQSSAIHHFYEKLLKLPALMNTSKGKALAEERADYMKSFLQQFYSEWTFKE